MCLQSNCVSLSATDCWWGEESLSHTQSQTQAGPEAPGRHQWEGGRCEGSIPLPVLQKQLSHANTEYETVWLASNIHTTQTYRWPMMLHIAQFSLISLFKPKLSLVELAFRESPHISRVWGYRLPAMTKPAIIKAPPTPQISSFRESGESPFGWLTHTR